MDCSFFLKTVSALGSRDPFSHLSCNPFLSLLEPLLFSPRRPVRGPPVLPEFPPHSYIHFLSDPTHPMGPATIFLLTTTTAPLQNSLSLSPESQPAFPAAHSTPCLVVGQAPQNQPAPDSRTPPSRAGAWLASRSLISVIHPGSCFRKLTRNLLNRVRSLCFPFCRQHDHKGPKTALYRRRGPPTCS